MDIFAKGPGSGVTALHTAAEHRSPELTKLLLAHKASPAARTATGDTPLHRALRHHNVKVAKALIDAGADLECEDTGGRKPLADCPPDVWEAVLGSGFFNVMEACRSEAFEELQRCVRTRGFNPNRKGPGGWTPFMQVFLARGEGWTQGSIRMAVHRGRRGGGVPSDPPPPDQSDLLGEKTFASETSGWAIFGIFGSQSFGSQDAPSPPF